LELTTHETILPPRVNVNVEFLQLECEDCGFVIETKSYLIGNMDLLDQSFLNSISTAHPIAPGTLALKRPCVGAPEDRIDLYIDLSTDSQHTHIESIWGKVLFSRVVNEFQFTGTVSVPAESHILSILEISSGFIILCAF
jgi:hypothetical protein